ncbi:MAG: zinc ABC transporter substrate-binding protein [Anaerolineales bacterium]|nr:zinc ABC transporter substrate-binding protein [Anaerolineales bacterium]
MKKVLWTLVLFSLALAACQPALAQEAGDLAQRPIRAVATTGMIADIVKNVGGERVQVTGLMGPGIDPHLYKASERNVITLADADIIFYNGLHLEASMATVFEKMEGKKRTVPVTAAIPRDVLLAPPMFAGNYDPHVWFDVSLWMSATETVRDALVELDPTHASQFQANAAAYLSQLKDLDAYVRQQAAKVPPQQRVLITAHDAFNYFGRAYAFEVRGLQGISTATEAGTADVQELAEFIVARRIPAIFVESSVPQRNIEAVQAAVQARGYQVRVGGQLFSDAMGNTGTPEGTYIGMVRYNIDTIVSALLAQ